MSLSINTSTPGPRQIAYYNFCRIHQTLRATPAMEAGLADHAWKIAELLEEK